MYRAVLFLVACTASETYPIWEAGSPDDATTDTRKVPPPDFDSSTIPVTGPDKLSDTGLYAPGVISYAPRYELWSDGAAKSRFLYLPPSTTIDTTAMDAWIFPVGTKAWKEFWVGGKRIETRLLWKERADAWWEVAYVWTADGSDAIATPGGLTNAAGTTHDVPSQNDCDRCHGNVPDVLIGVSALQLSQGGTGLLSQLGAQGRLSAPPPGEFEVPGAGTTKDALAYLHANCGHCHNGESRVQQQTTLSLDLDTTDMTPQDTPVYKTAFNLTAKHTLAGVDKDVVPGDPQASQLWLRMQHRQDGWEMPPLATKVVDDAGVAAVGSWISSLP